MKKILIKFILKNPKFVISIISIFFAGSIIANKILSAPASIEDLKKRVEVIECLKMSDFKDEYYTNKNKITDDIIEIKLSMTAIKTTNELVLNELKEIRSDIRNK